MDTKLLFYFSLPMALVLSSANAHARRFSQYYYQPPTYQYSPSGMNSSTPGQHSGGAMNASPKSPIQNGRSPFKSNEDRAAENDVKRLENYIRNRFGMQVDCTGYIGWEKCGKAMYSLIQSAYLSSLAQKGVRGLILGDKFKEGSSGGWFLDAREASIVPQLAYMNQSLSTVQRNSFPQGIHTFWCPKCQQWHRAY